MKETLESSSAPSTTWGHSIYESEGRSSQGTKSASKWILSFPESWTVKDRFLLFILATQAYDILLEWTKLTEAERVFLTEKKVKNRIRARVEYYEWQLKHVVIAFSMIQ